MKEPVFDLSTYYPIFLYFFVLVGFAISVMILAHTIGPRKRTAVKEMPYESGMDPIGDARQRFDVKFYLIAILFLVFDVESAFMYPWAVWFKSTASMLGFVEMLLFVVVLVVALTYVWRKKAIGWD